ncbi:MAG: Fic family protein [Coriobacteriia bacterium]|nr:Fic family protein [Coriobacteriia bacterium]
MRNRAGTYTTNLTGDAAYQSFTPTPLPPSPPLALDDELMDVLVKAHRQLAILENRSSYIQSFDQFISMYVRKEALMSSQIEGTQATLEDVLDPLVDKNTNQDAAEVISYIKATKFAIGRLNELPLCNRLIKETHEVLMTNTRGQEKTPGEFRHSQNWIEGIGSTPKNAFFIPPSPEDMISALSDFEKYVNESSSLDTLIRAALIHYQFETIHPFLDGNGRIGRLLITLFLIEQAMLTMPVLGISYFLKKNKVEYYDRLSEVRSNGNYEQWVKFFLRAVYESAEDAILAIEKLSALHDHNVKQIHTMGRASQSALLLFCYLEQSPIIEISKTADALGVSFNTISSSVNRLVEAGILTQNSDRRRGRTFSYTAYLDILKEGTEI